MVKDYIRAAMKHATFEQLPDGRWYGRIPSLGDVWATNQTIDGCEESLRRSLEGWLVYRVTAKLPVPTVDGIQPIPERFA